MSVNLFGVRIHLGVFAAAAIACFINYGEPSVYAVGFCSVVLHEATHLIVMKAYGCNNPSVEILPGGVRIASDDFYRLGYMQSAVCLLSAPVANLMFGVVCLLFWKWNGSGWLRTAEQVNLCLGFLNLTPLSFLDGGRALGCMMHAAGKDRVANCAAVLLDLLSLSVMGGILVYTAVGHHFSVAFLLFFLYCLVASLRKS